MQLCDYRDIWISETAALLGFPHTTIPTQYAAVLWAKTPR